MGRLPDLQYIFAVTSGSPSSFTVYIHTRICGHRIVLNLSGKCIRTRSKAEIVFKVEIWRNKKRRRKSRRHWINSRQRRMHGKKIKTDRKKVWYKVKSRVEKRDITFFSFWNPFFLLWIYSKRIENRIQQKDHLFWIYIYWYDLVHKAGLFIRSVFIIFIHLRTKIAFKDSI